MACARPAENAVAHMSLKTIADNVAAYTSAASLCADDRLVLISDQQGRCPKPRSGSNADKRLHGSSARLGC